MLLISIRILNRKALNYVNTCPYTSSASFKRKWKVWFLSPRHMDGDKVIHFSKVICDTWHESGRMDACLLEFLPAFLFSLTYNSPPHLTEYSKISFDYVTNTLNHECRMITVLGREHTLLLFVSIKELIVEYKGVY